MATLLRVLAVSLVVGVFVGSSAADSTKATFDVTKLELDAKKIFDLSKEYSFKDFKEKYGKEYADSTQEKEHKKIFMDNALKAHVSKLAYAHNLIDYYFTINKFSDYTDEQLAEIRAAPVNERSRYVDVSVSVPKRTKGGRSLAALMKDEGPNATSKVQDSESEEQPEKKQSTGLGRTMRNFGTKIKHKLGDSAEAFVRLMNAMHIEQIHDYDWVARAIARKYRKESRPDLPDEVFVDHREGGCMIVPQSQSSCGSCYVFAALAYYEWLYCKQTKEVIKFSEQYVLDCSRESKDAALGCDGGYPESVSSFSARYGFDLYDNHRYATAQLPCIPRLLKKKGVAANKLGSIKLDKPELREITYDKFDKYLAQTPIIVKIFVDNKLKQYGGGVYSDDCKSVKRRGGHLVLLVGSGREDGREYWLIKNSWGRHWGEDGFLKLDKNSDCFGYQHVGYVLKTFTQPNGSYIFTKNPDYDRDLVPNLLVGQDFMKLLD